MGDLLPSYTILFASPYHFVAASPVLAFPMISQHWAKASGACDGGRFSSASRTAFSAFCACLVMTMKLTNSIHRSGSVLERSTA